MAYLFMHSLGRMCPDIESWHRPTLSPCRPLVGLFCRVGMPPYGLVTEWINDGCNFDWNLLAITWTLGVKHIEVCLQQERKWQKSDLRDIPFVKSLGSEAFAEKPFSCNTSPL